MSDRHASGLRTRLTIWITVTSVIGTMIISLVVASYLEEEARFDATRPLVAALDTLMAMDGPAEDAPATVGRPVPRLALFRDGQRVDLAAPEFLHEAASRTLESGTPLPRPRSRPEDLRLVFGAPATGAEPLLVAARTDDAGRQLLAVGSGTGLAIAERAIRRSMLFLLPIVGIASAVATWFVAGIAVQPILALRRAADTIQPASVDRPIDVTDDHAPFEIQRLQSALNEALERVDAGYRSQERFLLNVSHELKTPISVVLAEAQVRLGNPGIDEEEARILRGVVEEMRRLGSLVESFLLLARVRHGDQPRRMQRVGLDELIADSADACTGFAEGADVQLAVRLDASAEEVGATVDGDPDLLRTMLDNLVRNAARFTPRGGIVVIEASVRDDRAELSVCDEGPGIPEELLPRLFDRFSQADSERRRERGTGLGMAIAAGVAELHGGTLEAENLEKGCRVIARLPLSPDTPSAGAPEAAPATGGERPAESTAQPAPCASESAG